MKPLTYSIHPGTGWTGWPRALKLTEMKTEDLLAYEREREIVSLIFAQGSIELALPLAVERARPNSPQADPSASSCEACGAPAAESG